MFVVSQDKCEKGEKKKTIYLKKDSKYVISLEKHKLGMIYQEKLFTKPASTFLI
jgi:hypothetical protein